jgi:hypothetical protein
MRLPPVAVLAAALVLFTAPIARALPDCEEHPELPICNPDPDPDPCELDPASCEPEPEPDPCELDPASCEPTPEPEPEPEPIDYPLVARLEGTYLVKGEGLKRSFPKEPSFYFNADHFDLSFGKAGGFEGTLVPKGKQGKKFELILDAASATEFAAFVAEQMGIVAGREPQAAVGQSAKMIFVLRDDETALLKIKASVVESDGDEIVFKLKMTGPVVKPVKG